ncbi:MAG: TGS domain-containing protein [Sulfolobaceae archaeon]|nr:TGS domain-containing protein [Sulfolobaceae archaeon]
MVTNLPAEAKAKWLKYMDAKTPEEKLKALQEFLSAVPKHKGTENLVYWAKRRMAELKEEVEREKRKGGKGGGGLQYFIEKTGAGQVVLLGEDNSLKNELMRRLTGITIEPKELPVPGITYYEDVQIQIINTPSLIYDAKVLIGRITGLVRNADAVLLAVNDEEELRRIKDFLERNNIILGKPKGKILIDRSRYGAAGIRIINLGKIIDATEADVKKYIESFGIKSAMIKIIGEVSLDDVEKSLFESITYKPYTLVSRTRFSQNVFTLDEIPQIKENLFRNLDVIRIYTKEPKEEASKEPMIVKRGTTVIEVARKLHSSLAEEFKYARVWGKSVKFQGQKVGEDHVLEDGDIVEIHTH